MQFRKVANRIQCLVAEYRPNPNNPAVKRTYQKMVFSFESWRTDFSQLSPADFKHGTEEERLAWIDEIRAYGAEQAAERDAWRDSRLVEDSLQHLDKLSEKLVSQPDLFSGSDLKRLRAASARLTKAMDARSGKKKS